MAIAVSMDTAPPPVARNPRTRRTVPSSPALHGPAGQWGPVEGRVPSLPQFRVPSRGRESSIVGCLIFVLSSAGGASGAANSRAPGYRMEMPIKATCTSLCYRRDSDRITGSDSGPPVSVAMLDVHALLTYTRQGTGAGRASSSGGSASRVSLRTDGFRSLAEFPFPPTSGRLYTVR